MRQEEANRYSKLAVEHRVRRATSMRHANTQSGILYTRQHQHLQASGDARRVSGVRAAVCVARSRLRCEEVLCCGCRLMWMPSELEDDSPLQPPARATRSRAGGPCPPVLRPGAPPYASSTSVSSNGPSPAPFHLPKLIRSSIAVYCCIVSSGVTYRIEVRILFIYKSEWAVLECRWFGLPANYVLCKSERRQKQQSMGCSVSYESDSCAEN